MHSKSKLILVDLSSNFAITFSNFFNRYECGITNILYQGEIGVWILAYRAISSVDQSFFLKNTFENISASKNLEDIYKDEPAIQNLFQSCKLVTHNGSDLYSAPELMKESLVAVFLTRCLQSRGYFDKNHNPEENVRFTDSQMKVGIWIHHLMRAAKFNSHEVTEYTVTKKEKCEHNDVECCR